MHNEDEIRRLDLHLGDTVLVQRAGDVIPKIVKVIVDKRSGDEPLIAMPQVCPDCSTQLFRADEESAVRCPNAYCPAQQIRGLIHYCGKAGLDIEGLGKRAVEQLYEQGLVFELPDIYTLKVEDLSQLDGWGVKSAQKVIQAIEVSKQTTLSRFVAALGIRFIGEVTSQLLEQRFEAFEALQNAGYADFLDIEGIGEQSGASLADYFLDPKSQEILNRLIREGVTFVPGGSSQDGGTLTGSVFVFTGTLHLFSRSEAKSRVKELGGHVVSSASKKVTHVVCGEKAGSKKKKAEELGSNVLSEKEFSDLI